jgi:hypothetical protein
MCSMNHAYLHHRLIRVKRGVLTVRIRNLRPQARGTFMAPITPMKGSHVAGLGIQGGPNPRLMRLVRDDAAHGIPYG